jgi:3-deoxy-D-manno-octulosonate 8-phosphate phosphatase (KDO 8-P phosphatase)
VLDKFKKIKVFVFDVDGVLTDGTILLIGNGVQARQMHIKDGLALQMAIRNGYPVVIISGAYSEPVVERMHYLGLTEVFTAIKNKKQFLINYCAEKGVEAEHVLFMGDDLPDVTALEFAGLSSCPSDAVPEVQEICDYISPVKGGYGCVRDIIEKVLRINGHWKFQPEITSR